MNKTVSAAKMRKAVVPLEGVHCASCVARLEKGLGSLAGVGRVSVHLPSKTAFMFYDPSLITPVGIEKKIEALGYKALAFSESMLKTESVAVESLLREKDMLLRRLLLSAVGTLFLLSGGFFELSNYTSLPVAAVVWLWGGWHFHKGMLKSLKAASADMNTLVSMSTSVTFFYGVFVTVFPSVMTEHYHAQWHEVAMLITFINLGRWLEARSKNSAGEAVSRLFSIAPKFARRVTAAGEETVRVSDIIPDDLISLRPGEQVPVDGMVTGGASAVDESLLTGEVSPADKAAGSKLYAGTINKNGVLEFKATGVGEDMVLTKIVRAVAESQAAKSSIQRLVDKISAWFVPAVFFVAAFSAAVWVRYGSVSQAVNVFAAVLAVACPCAMGLAIPMAVAVGFGRAAASGILIRNPDVLERAAKLDTVLLDKTGTLTSGRLRVTNIKPDGMTGEKFLELLAAAEEKSEHPLALAVRQLAAERAVKTEMPGSFEAVPGKGVRVSLADGRILAGSAKWFAQEGVAVPQAALLELEGAQGPALLLALNGEFKGYAEFGDSLRPEAAQVLSRLRAMGIEPVLVSGDHKNAVSAVANKLSIKAFYYEILPDEKRRIVMRYKALGRKTAMVGDGFNDAAALSEADIGVAMRSGADIAVRASDITLMKDDLVSLVEAVKLSKAIKKIINQNLFWAFAYNVILIPLAAGALYPSLGLVIPPYFAGGAMALSSVSVVMNSLRLRKMKV
ncbi:MAG: copper-translocating P-type ATPase [Elusimicrobia bacterium GWC2_51_8]|nr:MAG: copper-translocating P-type ATPase [Elusimicrobia bacterium GWA2_51_34]OGR59847.1 MAG: copper-translocating P-type ATPase [Elusimicrobia bacterium GWC2_51_8]OGR88059.1 MAG: copper-translocating P-type ATPase [Elusimicrobia bacterium GWF2_52_66]HAF95772.1 heavy metal translocating P-type ATPase [Elusimicrobiota bacterium]HCE99182.1 heavy metal translocating P-type ATPase [Elusimicrobiota bacterium]